MLVLIRSYACFNPPNSGVWVRILSVHLSFFPSTRMPIAAATKFLEIETHRYIVSPSGAIHSFRPWTSFLSGDSDPYSDARKIGPWDICSSTPTGNVRIKEPDPMSVSNDNVGDTSLVTTYSSSNSTLGIGSSCAIWSVLLYCSCNSSRLTKKNSVSLLHKSLSEALRSHTT